MNAVRLAVVAAFLAQSVSAFAAGSAAPGTPKSSVNRAAGPQPSAVPFMTHAESMITEPGDLVAQQYTILRRFEGMSKALVVTRRDISRMDSGQKLVALSIGVEASPANNFNLGLPPTFVDFDELAGVSKALHAMSAISAEAKSPELIFSTRGGLVMLATIDETTRRPSWVIRLQKSQDNFSFMTREDVEELSKEIAKVLASG